MTLKIAFLIIVQGVIHCNLSVLIGSTDVEVSLYIAGGIQHQADPPINDFIGVD